jgi:hypothetical protein
MCASTAISDAENKHVLEKCVNEIPTILSAPIAEMHSTSHLLIASVYERPTDLCVPCADFHSSIDLRVPTETFVFKNDHMLGNCANDIPTILSTPTVEVHSSIAMRAQTEILANDNTSCDLIVDCSLGHIKLVRFNEVLAVISHANSLFSITMDLPISLSHTRDKIAELICLKSVYTPDFTFNLIGEYDLDNVIMVHRICVMCDDSASLKANKSMNMLSHFDMTSDFNSTCCSS